jgi:hypothetical protein
MIYSQTAVSGKHFITLYQTKGNRKKQHFGEKGLISFKIFKIESHSNNQKKEHQISSQKTQHYPKISHPKGKPITKKTTYQTSQISSL